MDKFRENLQKHKTIAWIIILGYIAFSGCFAFPFSNELFGFNLEKGLMIAVNYGIIGMCFTGLFNKSKWITVLSLSFIFTLIGMGCRYLLEYGEYSNTINFIPINIILFIVIVPLYCMIVHLGIYKFCSK